MSGDAPKTKPKRPWWRRLLRGLLIILLLLFLLLLLGNEFWLIETLFKLGTGWWLFLQRNLAALHINPERILTSLVVLGFAVAGLHLLARAWRRHLHPQAQAWRSRWSLCISGLALLLACSAMAVAGLAHQVAWMSEQPLLQWNHGQFRNSSHARQLAMVIKAYADEHDNLCPPDLETLTRWSHREEIARLEKLLFYQIDPSHTPEPWLYFGAGHRTSDKASTLLLASPRPIKGKRLMVTMDNMTSFEPESDFQKKLKEWRATRANARPENTQHP